MKKLDIFCLDGFAQDLGNMRNRRETFNDVGVMKLKVHITFRNYLINPTFISIHGGKDITSSKIAFSVTPLFTMTIYKLSERNHG